MTMSDESIRFILTKDTSETINLSKTDKKEEL